MKRLIWKIHKDMQNVSATACRQKQNYMTMCFANCCTVHVIPMSYFDVTKYAGRIKMFCYMRLQRLRWSRGSVLAFGTLVRGFKPGRSRQIFRAKKSSARLPSEGK
jgi:hypothetical protein